MAYALSIGFKVEDYDKWKADFDDAAAERRELGQGDYEVFRIHDDPDTFVVLVEWDSLEQARAAIESDEMQEIAQRSGIIEMGEMLYLVEVDRGTLD